MQIFLYKFTYSSIAFAALFGVIFFIIIFTFAHVIDDVYSFK